MDEPIHNSGRFDESDNNNMGNSDDFFAEQREVANFNAPPPMSTPTSNNKTNQSRQISNASLETDAQSEYSVVEKKYAEMFSYTFENPLPRKADFSLISTKELFMMPEKSKVTLDEG